MIHLGTDLLPHQFLCLQAQHVNLRVAVAHVADNAPILHLVHVVAGHHVLVSSCRDHYINTLDYLCQFHNLSEKQIMVPEQNILDDGCDTVTVTLKVIALLNMQLVT